MLNRSLHRYVSVPFICQWKGTCRTKTCDWKVSFSIFSKAQLIQFKFSSDRHNAEKKQNREFIQGSQGIICSSNWVYFLSTLKSRKYESSSSRRVGILSHFTPESPVLMAPHIFLAIQRLSTELKKAKRKGGGDLTLIVKHFSSKAASWSSTRQNSKTIFSLITQARISGAINWFWELSSIFNPSPGSVGPQWIKNLSTKPEPGWIPAHSRFKLWPKRLDDWAESPKQNF